MVSIKIQTWFAATALLIGSGAVLVGGEKKKTIDTSFVVPVKRPILCTRTSRVDCELTVRSGKAAQKSKVTAEEDTHFVDEHTLLTADVEECTRLFVKSSVKLNGDIVDPPYAGLQLHYKRTGEVMNLVIKNDRSLPQTALDSHLRAGASLGFWIDLPRKASVGTTYEIDLLSIAPALLGGGLPVESAKASLKFTAYDVATGVAKFEGSAELAEKGEIEGLQGSSEYSGQCALLVNAAEKRIVSASFKGTMRLDLTGPFAETQGQGSYSAEVKTEMGEPVTKARAEKAGFRENTHRVPQYGVRVSLPSYFARMPVDPKYQRFLRTLDASNGVAMIFFESTPGDPAKSAEFFEGVEAGLKESRKDAKVSRVGSALGLGLAIEMTDKNEEGTLFQVRMEMYRAKGFYLVYKLVAVPKAFPAAEKEFVEARDSIQHIK